MTAYRAGRGDIVRLSLNPRAGHEQSGRRPAPVISNGSFNRCAKSAAMVCPVTDTDRNCPRRVRLDGRTAAAGAVMCDQAKILDAAVRNAEFIERVPEDIVFEAADIAAGIIEFE